MKQLTNRPGLSATDMLQLASQIRAGVPPLYVISGGQVVIDVPEITTALESLIEVGIHDFVYFEGRPERSCPRIAFYGRTQMAGVVPSIDVDKEDILTDVMAACERLRSQSAIRSMLGGNYGDLVRAIDDGLEPRRRMNREHPPRYLIRESVVSSTTKGQVAVELSGLVAQGVGDFAYIQALDKVFCVRFIVEPDGARIVVQNLNAEMSDTEILADIAAVRDELGLKASSWN